ncbi:MAG: RluA family pseudouridine synthase [Pseudobdellovibrionaceae bacterium]|uniref:RluA family pseudouridine synthase n=1 Tax=Oligoflexus sp. TaxID=1971216 RepID=UPI0027C14448|nr:RluA family pseudouridine synthase [Oligoflexus sp.]MDQ3230964.1 RluA family pseudouridine synthase [Pseudobdellovibrionaceae bacterium]HYX36096.1 RluA family pseudouridine synthase [Oligoflexus sp.]
MARDNPTQLILTAEGATGSRLDVFLAQALPHFSRSALHRLIKAGEVKVNGVIAKASYKVEDGDQLDLQSLPPDMEKAEDLVPTPLPLHILYEDQALIVINKPAGLIVHPGAGTRGKPTLVAAVLAHLGLQRAEDLPGEADRPGVVHRLDKDTSGVIVLAKTAAAHRHLAAQFKNKTNLREYVTLLNGAMDREEIEIESYLYRDPRNRTRFTSMSMEDYLMKDNEGGDMESYRYAKTNFSARKVYGRKLTLALVRLTTGRTHQIRVHAKTLGWPVVGDVVYGPEVVRLPPTFPEPIRLAVEEVSRQLLHARRLGFEHPETGQKMAFEAPIPQDFRAVLELLEKHRDQ